MPVATLTFQIPNEQDEFKLACDGKLWYGAMSEMAEFLRKKIKYGDQEQFEPVAEELYNILDDYGISFGDVS